jgi:uncharacterized membrane protein YhfC
MLGYRAIDMSTVPGIPADQVELAKQQVAAYWAVEPYIPLIGSLERIFAMCLHVGLSVMVLFAIAKKKPLWFWIALLWHALVDAVAVFTIQSLGVLAVEGIVAVMAGVTLVVALWLRPMFADDAAIVPQPEIMSQ